MNVWNIFIAQFHNRSEIFVIPFSECHHDGREQEHEIPDQRSEWTN